MSRSPSHRKTFSDCRFSIFDFKHRSALSLLEMVVVLGVMTILAGVAIRSLEPIADQSRYDATVRSLENFERSILATERDSSDRLMVRGFVADMGRLPKAIALDRNTQAQELWDRNASMATNLPYLVSEYIDPDIDGVKTTVAAGWRGPYLEVGADRRQFRDGWGRPFWFDNDLMGLQPGDPIRTCFSLGSDSIRDDSGVPDANAYSRDLSIPSESLENAWQGSVQVVVNEYLNNQIVPYTPKTGNTPPENESLRVHLYGPLDGLPKRIFPPEGTTSAPPTSATNLFLVNDIAVGQRVVVAMITTGEWPAVSVKRKAIQPLMVLGGMNTVTVVLDAAVTTPVVPDP